MPAVIILDRDSNFYIYIWQVFFERMWTKLFILTVYLPQTDGISKRTNQTVEIIIRFFPPITPKSISFWHYFFSKRNSTIHLIQLPGYQLMNSITVSKCAKSFPVSPNQKFITIYRPKGSNTGKKQRTFLQSHIPLLFNAGNYVYLILYHSFDFPTRFNNKNFNNDADFFAFSRN